VPVAVSCCVCVCFYIIYKGWRVIICMRAICTKTDTDTARHSHSQSLPLKQPSSWPPVCCYTPRSTPPLLLSSQPSDPLHVRRPPPPPPPPLRHFPLLPFSLHEKCWSISFHANSETAVMWYKIKWIAEEFKFRLCGRVLYFVAAFWYSNKIYFICMHACFYVCIHVYMTVCMSVCMFVCIYASVHVCMHACMYVCMYIRLQVRMFVCTYIYVCMHVCTYVRMYIWWMYVCIYISNYVLIHIVSISAHTF